MAYKAIALTHLAYYYLSAGVFDPVSLGMIVCGFGLSFAALLAIGVDATYFGIELGRLKFEEAWISSFPYSVMRHPMISGNLLGLLGIMKLQGFAGPSWLVPMHMGLYVLHMLQEHYEVYERPAGGKAVEEKKIK